MSNCSRITTPTFYQDVCPCLEIEYLSLEAPLPLTASRFISQPTSILKAKWSRKPPCGLAELDLDVLSTPTSLRSSSLVDRSTGKQPLNSVRDTSSPRMFGRDYLSYARADSRLPFASSTTVELSSASEDWNAKMPTCSTQSTQLKDFPKDRTLGLS